MTHGADACGTEPAASRADPNLVRAMAEPPDARLPLAPAQEGLWLLDRLHPGGATYNEFHALVLAGPLDRGALARAFDALVARHPALRTRFVLEGGRPWRRVAGHAAAPLDVVDLRTAESPVRDAMARRLAREESRRPFDLARAPLLRARLLVLDAERHWLLVTMHHIAADGWSTAVLASDLAMLYAACRGGGTPPLPAVEDRSTPRDGDARASHDESSGEAAVAWWGRELDGLPSLALPLDRPRPALADSDAASVHFGIEAPLVARIGVLGRRERATTFMIWLAALQALLHRWCGQDDFAIGVPVAGRDAPGLERRVGHFVNMLALRADVSGAPDFAELVRRVRARAIAAFDRRGVRFERVVAALAPRRTASTHPLFDVSFALHPGDAALWRFDGLAVTRIEDLDAPGAKFDLAFTFVERDGAIAGRVDYATALFERSTIEGLVAGFRALLASIADDPACAICRLPLLGRSERAARIEQGRGRRRALAADARIEDAVTRQARAHPHATAIVDGDASLDYATLDDRASALAHALREAGVRDGDRVGLCLDRGRALVVAMLAVLKARATYVPLDPAAPESRLRSLLGSIPTSLIVADERALPRVPREGARRARIDRDGRDLTMEPPSTEPARLEPGDPAIACVMSTSGSTGRPKGVLVPHRAVLNLVVEPDYARVDRGEVVAHLAHPAFDATTFELWGPLVHGATIVVVDRSTALAPKALAAAIRAHGVSTLFVTTALFNAIARDAPGAFASCRQVLFGGEAVEPARVRSVLEAGAPSRLVHVYGPTETTTFATWHEVTLREAREGSIPIGRAVAGAEVYVLGQDGEPVPPGFEGEIVIGGNGVATGYLGAAPDDDARFVAHPFDGAGARAYRSGDRARWRADGAIVFAGRSDRQVKIRGQRVELPEVEAALTSLTGVAAATVALRGATSDTRRIVAWLVPDDPARPPPEGVNRELRRILPEAMIPAAIVWVPSLPLTATGKIDTRALPEPTDVVRPGGGASVPPRDMFETLIAALWERLLGRRGIGVYDRFFDLGGHSLLAAAMVDALERETGYALPLSALFEDDTIDAIARRVRENAPKAATPFVVVNEDARGPPLVFLHGDFEAGGFYSAALARALGSDQRTIIVHPHGLDGGAVPATIEAMASERLEALRSVHPSGPVVLAGHCNGALVAFEMARQLVAAGERVPAVLLIESRAPGAKEGDGGAPESYVRFDEAGRPRLLRPEDRRSELEIAYNLAIDRYAGGRYDGRVVVIQAQEWRHPSPDAGWARFAGDCVGLVVPGGHVTLVTRHLPELARAIGAAIGAARASA